MNEMQVAHTLLSNATNLEKIGIVGFSFIICTGLLYLLRRATSDKKEVLAILEEHKKETRDLLDRDREDRVRFYEKMIEAINEMKAISKQSQEINNTLFKAFLEKGGK